MYICIYVYVCMCVCVYVCMCVCVNVCIHVHELPLVGWHYLSNATRLMRPHLLYEVFLVSRITIICNILRHV